MKAFPDESAMPKSPESHEPIRGGSIGLNRILNRFVDRAARDNKPEFMAYLISAYAVVRNVMDTKKANKVEARLADIESAFVQDVNLFMEYLDTYLSFTWNQMWGAKKVPVLVYFPDYHRVNSKIRREFTGRDAELQTMYQAFLKHHGSYNEIVKVLDHCQCYWVSAGQVTYPHVELAGKFRDIGLANDTVYQRGDPIGMITNMPLDYHIDGRLRNVSVIKSYHATVETHKDFRFRLDKEGRIPFTAATHLVFGDNALIKQEIPLKTKRLILETAEKEKWASRSETDVYQKLVKLSDLPARFFKDHDFR